MTILWKLNRFRAMGVSEVAYRVVRATTNRLEKYGVGIANTVNNGRGKAEKISLITKPCGFELGRYSSAADRILEGQFNVFSLGNTELGFPPNWNEDPRTGINATLTFGKIIDYRDPSIVGDVKYLWEFNRHLELTTLAQAFHLTKDEKYATGIQVLLESWFDQCPYPLGLNWTSSLEHAIRLVNWSFTWHLLDGENSVLFSGKKGEVFRTRWLCSIYQHCHFINGHLSFHSSANNHLFSEYMGLFVGSLIWPLWPESEIWKKRAKEAMEVEALKQTGVDGVNKEQAIWYHHSVVEIMLLSGLVARANDYDFSMEYWNRLESMLEFTACLMDHDGNVPMFGDSDDAVMVRFSQESEFNVYHSQLATGAILFDRSDFKAKAGKLDDKTRWLLGDIAEQQFDEIQTESAKPPVCQSFSEGGYYILGHHFETPQEVRIIADAGPLGYLSIAAHGHADALSFVFSIAGHEILVDPGTYAYHTHKKWRDYFRGTSAHNTIEVDGEDQSVSGGNFMWFRHAKSYCLKFERSEDKDYFVASHDGYKRLKDPVTHTREISFDKQQNSLTVNDFIECDSNHSIAQYWHFSEYCQAEILDNSRVCIQNGCVKIILKFDPELNPILVSGQESPPLGWISRRFDKKEAIQTLMLVKNITSSTIFTITFEIKINPGESIQ